MTDSPQFRPMRRFKQQLCDEACIEILKHAPRGVLAVLGDFGYPYTIPLNFVYENGKIFFHCAKEGHKIDAIRNCDKASFCVLNEGVKEPGSWWYHFESVVCFGRIRIINDRTLAYAKLRLFGAKYFPEDYDIEHDMSQNAPHAEVLELSIEHITGKSVKEK